MGKKGLAGGTTEQILAVGAGFSYIWYIAPDNFGRGYEHVPMVKTTFNIDNTQRVAREHPSSYWLFFNEPDFPSGDGKLSPTDAARVYGNACAVINSITSSARFIVGGLFWPTNTPWFDSFLSEYQRLYGALPVVHGWHVHAYADASNYTTDKWRNDLLVLQRWVDAKTPGAEVWITEFGCLNSQPIAKRVMQEQVPWMDGQAWITRYAWYTSFVSGQQGSLFTGDTSTAKTELGTIYTSLGGPPPPPVWTPPAFVGGIRTYSDPAITVGCPHVIEFGGGSTVNKRFVCWVAKGHIGHHRADEGGVGVDWV